jgi:hypothetical protein
MEKVELALKKGRAFLPTAKTTECFSDFLEGL